MSRRAKTIGVAGIIATTAICLGIVLLADDDDPGSAPDQAGADSKRADGVAVTLGGATPADEAIAADLLEYIHSNYGAATPQEPSEELSPRQRERLQELDDNISGLPGSIEGITVSDSIITVETNLSSDDEGLTSAELICTIIYGADEVDRIEGHQIIGAESSLIECTQRTSPL